MEFEYEVYEPGSTEAQAFKLKSAVPLPNIAVGNSLLPLVSSTAPKSGHHWVIRHIETSFYSPDYFAQPKTMRVSVFTIERDRIEICEHLRSATRA